MARGVPKKTQTDDKGITKMEAVRRALAELGQDAQPSDIQSYVKSKFGIDMEKTMISSYKTSLKAAGKSALTRKPKSQGARATSTRTTGGISLDDIRAVKELADRIGADKVRELAEVLSK
jgi:hypothetical protein